MLSSNISPEYRPTLNILWLPVLRLPAMGKAPWVLGMGCCIMYHSKTIPQLQSIEKLRAAGL